MTTPTTMPTHVIRLWELDDERAPARLIGTDRLDDDGMGSFVEIANNYTEPEPIDCDPITVYPAHTVDSVNIKIIGAAATRFNFDRSCNYALELWTATKTHAPHDDGPDKRWAYLVIPAMRRPHVLAPWRVLVAGSRDNPDTDTDTVTREVDEVMTRDEHGDLVPLEGTYIATPESCYPAVCFRTDRGGHKWGVGPAPTAYSDSGEPVYLPEPLGQATTHVFTLTNMSPADALAYPDKPETTAERQASA